MANAVCPWGCDPAQLEKEVWGGFQAAKQHYPPQIRYHCEACDWTAVWSPETGLETYFWGVRQHFFEGFVE